MGVSSWTRSKQGGESKHLTVEVSLQIAVKDTFLRGREGDGGRGRGRRREKLQRVKAAQGMVFLALGGVLSVGVNFQDGIIPSQPSGSELPGWDYPQSSQMCGRLGKARPHAVAFRGRTRAGAGASVCLSVCALNHPLQPMDRQMLGQRKRLKSR